MSYLCNLSYVNSFFFCDVCSAGAPNSLGEISGRTTGGRLPAASHWLPAAQSHWFGTLQSAFYEAAAAAQETAVGRVLPARTGCVCQLTVFVVRVRPQPRR